MPSAPYIKHGNLFFIPCIRQRLSFAILVRRAVHSLKLDNRDAIAVALPSSVRNHLLHAISSLKKHEVRYLEARYGHDGPREVFPVTPNDAMIEGIRLSSELAIPLEFVDEEVEPARLLKRRCETQVDWPDDGLALEFGPEWYLELIQNHLGQPPIREEPLDAERELYIANQLRRLAPLRRQVLAVVDAHNIAGVRRFLSSSAVSPGSASRPVRSLKIIERVPSLSALLSFLDDMPFLVQQYESSRQDGLGSEFDRIDSIIEAISSVAQESRDLYFSPNCVVAFSNFLNNLVQGTRRVVPSLETVLLAAAGCFNQPFAERVRSRLLSYGALVPVDAIGRADRDYYSAFRTLLEKQGSPQYVQRSCNPAVISYELHRGRGTRVGDKTNKSNRNGWNVTWPKWVWHVMNMVDRARRLAKENSETVKSEVFRGTLNAGIDVRRTLRAHFEGRHELWTRRYKRLVTRIPRKDDPVVFLFGVSDSHGATYFSENFNAVEGEEWLTYFDLCGGPPETVRTPAGVEVHCQKIVGMTLFADMRWTNAELRSKFGDDLAARVPKYGNRRIQQPECGEYDSWASQLLHAALDYCVDGIICVCLENWQPSDIISSRVRSEGKVIRTVSLSSFTQEEKRKLRTLYHIENWDIKPPADSNELEFNLKVADRYESDMREFWN